MNQFINPFSPQDYPQFSVPQFFRNSSQLLQYESQYNTGNASVFGLQQNRFPEFKPQSTHQKTRSTPDANLFMPAKLQNSKHKYTKSEVKQQRNQAAPQLYSISHRSEKPQQHKVKHQNFMTQQSTNKQQSTQLKTTTAKSTHTQRSPKQQLQFLVKQPSKTLHKSKTPSIAQKLITSITAPKKEPLSIQIVRTQLDENQQGDAENSGVNDRSIFNSMQSDRSGRKSQDLMSLTPKNKFKSMVQSTCPNLEKHKTKSLFNLIISAEFNIAHQVERKTISDEFEKSNVIVGKQMTFKKKQQFKNRKFICNEIPESQEIYKDVEEHQIQFHSAMQAFNRKILQIHQSSFNQVGNTQQKFSLLPKKFKQSQVRQSNFDIVNTQAYQTMVEQIRFQDCPIFNVTVSFEGQDVIHKFQHPQFRKKSEPKLEVRVQKKAPTIVEPSTTSSPKHFQRTKSRMKSFAQQDSSTNITNLNVNQEYSKANLYFRMYYQLKLQKLVKKSKFTFENLQQIPTNCTFQFESMIQLVDYQQVKKHPDCFQRITSSIQIQLPFVVVQPPEQDNVSSQPDTFSESEGTYSSPDQSIEYFYSDNNSTNLQSTHKSVMNLGPMTRRNSLLQLPSSLFVQDLDDYRKPKQISTGGLQPIRKIRKVIKFVLNLTPILSILDMETKNSMLEYGCALQNDNALFEAKFTIDDAAPLEFLDKQYADRCVRNMIAQGLNARFESVMIGKYSHLSKFIDLEHDSGSIKESKCNTQIKQPSKLMLIEMNQRYKSSQQLSKSVHSNQGGVSPQNISQYGQQIITQDTLLTKLGSLPTSQQPVTQNSTILLSKPTGTSLIRGSSARLQDTSFRSPLSHQSSFNSINNIGKDSPKETSIPIEKTSTKLETKQRKNTKQPTTLAQNKLDKQVSQSMTQFSLKMRTHASQASRKSNMDIKQIMQLAIHDNNYVELIELINQLPQSQLDAVLNGGNTYLILASQAGNFPIVKELIKRNADVNAQNDDGNTALHLALSYGHNQVADILTEAGALAGILNNKGQNAWSQLQF